jgi:hypothetical protein
MLACVEQTTEDAPLFIGTQSDRAEIERQEDEDAAHNFSERDYNSADYIAFCKQARAAALVPLSDRELICAYSRHTYSKQQLDENDEWAARDALDERQRIAGEAAEFYSGIPAHVAFKKAHDFLDDLEQKSRRSFHVAEFAADLNIAASHALRNDLTAFAFYCLWAEGKASDIPAHVLARSVLWYRIRSQVGDEILKRGLLNGYFRHTRKKRRNHDSPGAALRIA